MVRFTAQNLDAWTHPSGGVTFADEIVGGRPGGAGAATEEPNVHHRPLG